MQPSRLVALLLLFTAQPLWASTEALVERPARQSSRDVKIPRALVAKVEKEYRQFLSEHEISEKEELKRKLINVSVEMTQKRHQALHENVRVNTPLGGGVIDMAEFVAPLKGAFFVKILPRDDEDKSVSGIRVFFVSHAKTRNIGPEQYGSGCDKFMEITSFFHKHMGKHGFEVYSTEQRYLSVLGGTFVLVAFGKEALHVGSVTFGDSRYPELTCET
jgi:hypothetical protein